MARIEADREDLMAEAVALVRRMEFAPADSTPPCVVGFRQAGWFSVYLGPDLMFQFDAAGRLRRAFSAGLLYRTQGTTLAQLRRQRTETETVLSRHDLSDPDLNEFRQETLCRILWLRESLASGRLLEVRRIPENDDQLVDDVRQFLDRVLNSPEFLAPAITGKS